MMKTVILGIIVLLVSAGGLPAGDSLTVISVGDIMMGTDHPKDLLPPEGGRGIFDPVKAHLEGGDIVLGNLEGPLTDGGTPRKCRKPGETCYEFRTPASFAARLRDAGFTAMNIANNHSFDFGEEGIVNTVAALASAGIFAVGGTETAAFVVKGKRVTVLGFSFIDSPYSLPMGDLRRAERVIRRAKEGADLLVVSFHGGAEGASTQHLTFTEEEYLGEERGDVVKFARLAVDAGADIVLGHGPHVLRAMELYRGKLIAYSLGNFLGYERFKVSGPNGISVILRAAIDPETGDFLKAELVPVMLNGKGLPEHDDSGRGIELLRRLTNEDIPSPGLFISDEGLVVPSSGQRECPAP